MRVLFAGTPEVAVASLDKLVQDGFEIVAVLTREDAPVGRKRVMTPSPVAARALELGLPLIYANKIDAEAQSAITAAAPDIAAIVAFGGLVPPAALTIPRHGWINLHFSLLPAWRGAAPVQHSIIAGDGVTGAVTFQLEAGLDTGPVFETLTTVIENADTSGELLARLALTGAELLSSTLSGIDAGTLEPVAQVGQGSYAHKLGLSDGHVDWSRPAAEIRARINGVSPDPGAWTTLDEQRFKLGPVTEVPELTDVPPGRVRIEAGKRPRAFVGTGTHAVELGRVQPAGKKPMPASDWARGLGSAGNESVKEVAFS